MLENNGKMEFIYETGDGGSVKLTISSHAALADVLEAFEKFLLASGYCFNGMVDIVDADRETGEYLDPNAEKN